MSGDVTYETMPVNHICCSCLHPVYSLVSSMKEVENPGAECEWDYHPVTQHDHIVQDVETGFVCRIRFDEARE